MHNTVDGHHEEMRPATEKATRRTHALTHFSSYGRACIGTPPVVISVIDRS